MKAQFRTESLAACMVVASLALPSGAWAQRRATVAVTDGVANVASVVAPERPLPFDTLDAGRTPRLGDAMAEAYRSPFHAAARAPRLATGGDEAGVTVVRIPFSGGLVPDSAGGSTSFHTVLWPTLLTAVASSVGATFVVMGCYFHCPRDTMLGLPVFGLSVLVGAGAVLVAPPVVARSFGGGTWPKYFVGSTTGLALGFLGVNAVNRDVSYLFLPIAQALLTTAFGMSKPLKLDH